MSDKTPIFPQVLYVEDHADTAEMIGHFLLLHGFQTVWASSPKQALERVEAQEFAAIICDLGLPDLNGFELLPMLRQHTAAPAVALSGHAGEADIRRSVEAGFVEHLKKPTDVQRLVTVLREIVFGNRLPQGRA